MGFDSDLVSKLLGGQLWMVLCIGHGNHFLRIRLRCFKVIVLLRTKEKKPSTPAEQTA